MNKPLPLPEGAHGARICKMSIKIHHANCQRVMCQVLWEQYLHTMHWKAQALKSGTSGFQLWLCHSLGDLGQVMEPLCTSVSLSRKWEEYKPTCQHW